MTYHFTDEYDEMDQMDDLKTVEKDEAIYDDDRIEQNEELEDDAESYEELTLDEPDETDPSDDPYLHGDFPVHSYLQKNNLFDPKPTKERLKDIMNRYHNGTPEEQDRAKLEMLGILDPYIFNLLKRKYPTYSAHTADLLSHAYEGVMIGMKLYDPERGMPTTWFNLYINHEIQKYINTHINHSSPHYNAAMKKVLDCIDRKNKNHIPYTKGDIYRETGISLRTIEAGMRIRQVTHVPLNTDNENLIEIPAEYGVPERYYEQQEAANQVIDLVFGKIGPDGERHSVLNEEEKAVIIYRFGLDGNEVQNFVEIEKLTGIARYRVGKIQATALKKMREELDKEKRAKICHRLRDKVEKNNSLAGLLLSTDEMYSDQEAVAHYFEMGLLA